MVEIGDDPLLIKYFRKRHSTQGTINLYTYVFKKYYMVTGLTPTSMIDTADTEEEQGIRLKKRSINDYLDNFEDYLEENHTETTLKNAMSVIRTFYKFNSIQLPPINRRPPNPTPTESLVQLPNSDDIRKAISHSSVKYQAFIILLASSGMRQGDVRSLTLQHLINSLEKYVKLTLNDLFNIGEVVDLLPEKHGPLVWNVWMQKTNKYYTTFSTPESLTFILNYLEAQPPRKISENTPIFRNPYDQKLTSQAIGKYFRDLNRKCDFPHKKGFIYFRPHNLRKWFGNQLKRTTLGYLETRILLGHQVLDDTGQRYLKPDYDDLYKKYYHNMDNVTLYDKIEVHDITDERVKRLEDEIEMLKTHLSLIPPE